jgi:adenosylcobalamin-dependent ribonucleoside-triphosphate reductase
MASFGCLVVSWGKIMKYGSKNYRPLAPGMGEAVAKRTVLRKRPTGALENWGDVAKRVAGGNCSLVACDSKERERFRSHIANGSILMSGRHLQHGDEGQKERNQEVFTNCSTASASFLVYYLLLNGSGVGRAYDDDICVVDWRKMPYVFPVVSETHKDYDYKTMESASVASHKYGSGEGVHVFEVPDSREGWAQAVEFIESLTYAGIHGKEVVIVDFTKVRPKGAPIGGMQGRPSSGPAPMMNALRNVASLKGADMPKWRQAMYVDHYLAECVLVGGARRSARMSTKYWRDPGILDFISVKKGGHLWSSNNSVMVDEDFWKEIEEQPEGWAAQVFDAVCSASYFDGTGEPGLINQDKLVSNKSGLVSMEDGKYASSKRFSATHGVPLLARLAKVSKTKRYYHITNPCGEISLNQLGAYCVIGDVVPYFCDSIEEAEEAVRLTTRALIRTNTMDCVYRREVNRTNRIGVGLTGVHEWAWSQYGLSFADLIDEEKSIGFWLDLSRLSRAVKEEADKYSLELGVERPHTDTTIKPAGTTSKLFGLTEGAHLPSMKEYIRWVQFRLDDPLYEKYKLLGYQCQELRTYVGSGIVGFPTQPEICKLGMGDRLVTAAQASPEQQYKWLMLLEKYWIHGTDDVGRPLVRNTGNQVSYTLKYKPSIIDFKSFCDMIRKYQSKIRCCSVMPQVDLDDTAYEYQPEQQVTIEDYHAYVTNIKQEIEEDLDRQHLDCSTGACPVDFNKPTFEPVHS